MKMNQNLKNKQKRGKSNIERGTLKKVLGCWAATRCWQKGRGGHVPAQSKEERLKL